MRRNSMLVAINTLAVAALLVAGCLEVTPVGPVPPVPPGPNPNPPAPSPDTPLRRSVADSLSDVPKEDCVKLYGVFTAVAAFVNDGAAGVESTGQLLQLTQRTLDNLSWAKGKYPRLAETVRTALNERFKVPRKITDAKHEVAATFGEIAAGCRDAATRK